MQRARELANEIGMDKLVWEITDHPPEATSEKYQVGTDAWKKIYHEIWDTSQTCNALPEKKLLARITPPGQITITAGEVSAITCTVENVGGATWHKSFSGFRRSSRLGAQLYDESGNVRIDLNYSRAFLNNDMKAGDSDKLTLEMPAIEKPGRYKLRFDMCCEGIDWFDSGGSEVSWSELIVE